MGLWQQEERLRISVFIPRDKLLCFLLTELPFTEASRLRHCSRRSENLSAQRANSIFHPRPPSLAGSASIRPGRDHRGSSQARGKWPGEQGARWPALRARKPVGLGATARMCSPASGTDWPVPPSLPPGHSAGAQLLQAWGQNQTDSDGRKARRQASHLPRNARNDPPLSFHGGPPGTEAP